MILPKILNHIMGGAGHMSAAYEKPFYNEMKDFTQRSCFCPTQGQASWYGPVMIGSNAIARAALSQATLEDARKLLRLLSHDEYSNYVLSYYDEGINRFDGQWFFADIVTVLLALSKMLEPKRYLEIGVRRGRSSCAVASSATECSMFLFDMWVHNYAGMDNPGPDFVLSELAKVGHKGECRFVDGNSHDTLPRFFDENPSISFDLITVDGDHTLQGAAQDLRDVLPRLTVGGAVVFDDICHPAHPGLNDVWREMVCQDSRFSSFTYDDAGYGVGFALRKW